MPTPERTSLDDIVRVAGELLESGGMPALTMQAVADRVGVRAPSLYKRVRSRDHLVALVAEATLAEFGLRMDAAAARSDGDTLAALARTFRRFAHERPAAYGLVFAAGPGTPDPDAADLAAASASVLALADDLVGPEHALQAARTITAWVHGFVSMELAGAFRLGGEVDDAFEYGITLLRRALEAG